jgi:hypothetical protein
VQHYTENNLNHTFAVFKRTIAVETFKIIYKQSPSYLHDLISIKEIMGIAIFRSSSM